MTTPPKRGTAEEKAREIWEKLPGFDEANAEDGIHMIAAALEAERKAFSIEQEEKWHKAGYEDGYRRGLQDSAKTLLEVFHGGDIDKKDAIDAVRALKNCTKESP